MLGIAVGVYAHRTIQAQSDQLTGLALARVGLLLSFSFLVAGWSSLAYDYATEVPEGYSRISYSELQPPKGARANQIPRSARDLNEQQVFIKGYVFPDSKTEGITSFLLVRDQGDCCFGGNPKITDRIMVTLKPGLSIDFDSRLFKLGGIFRVHPADAAKGKVLYTLDADYLR